MNIATVWVCVSEHILPELFIPVIQYIMIKQLHNEVCNITDVFHDIWRCVLFFSEETDL